LHRNTVCKINKVARLTWVIGRSVRQTDRETGRQSDR